MKHRALVLCCALFLATALPALPAEAGDLAAAVPQSLDFLPPPPTENSTDFMRDKELYQQTRQLKGSERWKQAAFDAEHDLDKNGGALFADAFGQRISRDKTPALYALMEMVFKRIGAADTSAKKHYMRVRPFVYFKAEGQTCAPAQEAHLRTNGSYPSGHTARGWGMALVLAEISPERQAGVLKRGYDLGWSRVVCGVHWVSDVEAGRVVAAAAVAHLHTDPAFMELLKKAKAEVKKLRAADD